MTRLAQFGVIELEEVLDAMRQCPRGLHALSFPLGEEVTNLEASSLRIPWWTGKMHHSLLPGLFETCQIMQLLQIEKGDCVLLIGPRGNWWTELLMYIGAERIVVLEPDEVRREVLIERWGELRLDVVAKAFDCEIDMIGVDQLDDYTPQDGFDRVLSTGMFPSLPLSIMMRVQDRGYACLLYTSPSPRD